VQEQGRADYWIEGPTMNHSSVRVRARGAGLCNSANCPVAEELPELSALASRLLELARDRTGLAAAQSATCRRLSGTRYREISRVQAEELLRATNRLVVAGWPWSWLRRTARGQGQCASSAADTEESDTQRLGVVGALWPVLLREPDGLAGPLPFM